MPNIKHQFAPGAELWKSTVLNATSLHVIEAGTIQTADIADSAITNAKLAANSVTTDKISPDTVIAVDIATGAVGTDELADNAVTNVKMADNSVDTAEIVDTAVTVGKLASNSVITAKILDANVTTAKIAAGAVTQNKIEPSFVVRPFFAIAADWRFTNPKAVYYNGNTFVAFQGNRTSDPLNKDAYAMQFNHTSKSWSSAYLVGTNPIVADWDTHGSPSIIVDDSGYLHVFWGCHSSAGYPIKHSKSTNVEDVSAWTAKTSIAGAHTYPQVVKDDSGYLYIVTRLTNAADDASLAINKSVDGGDTWNQQSIVNPASPYITYPGSIEHDSVNNVIHITWFLYHTGVHYEQYLYHAYYKISDGHMYSQAGVDLGTEISLAEMDANCRVRDTGGVDRLDGGFRVRCNSAGTPFIIFPEDTTGAAAWRTLFTKWGGAAWDAPITVFDEYSKFIGDFSVSGADTINLFCTRSHGTAIGTIYQADIAWLRSIDTGATWKFIRYVANAFELGCPSSVPSDLRVFQVENSVDLFKMLISPATQYALGVADPPYGQWKLYGWGTSGFV